MEYVRYVCDGSGRRGSIGVGEWMREVCLGFTNPGGTGGVLDVFLCLGCGGVGSVGGEWGVGSGFGPRSGGVCGVMSV